mgnify:CR=1 FL=1
MLETESPTLENEDFILRIRPETDDTGEWTGDIDLAIITQPDNRLEDDDYSQLMHFCKMLASTVPVMERNEEFREIVHEYVMSMKDTPYDEDVETEDKPKVVETDGNVLTIDFGTKTKGSA